MKILKIILIVIVIKSQNNELSHCNNNTNEIIHILKNFINRINGISNINELKQELSAYKEQLHNLFINSESCLKQELLKNSLEQGQKNCLQDLKTVEESFNAYKKLIENHTITNPQEIIMPFIYQLLKVGSYCIKNINN